MIQTIEAVIDADGQVQLLEVIRLSRSQRVLVTILEEPAPVPGETALLAEGAIAEDWNRPEEDAAWSHLQSER